MPVMRYVFPEPTERVLQGEQLRQAVLDPNNPVQPDVPLLQGAPSLVALGSIIQDEDAFTPMNSYCEVGQISVRRAKNGVLQLRVNAGIATPCGAWISNDWSPLLLNNIFAGGTTQYWLSGTTRDSAGVALGSCVVQIFRTINDTLLVELTSNASGAWSVQVAEPGPFYYVCYKVGSPDLAGTSVNTNVPTTVN